MLFVVLRRIPLKQITRKYKFYTLRALYNCNLSTFSKKTMLKYPEFRRDASVIDEYHGNKVPDPYRYLEDPDSAETKEFVAKQNEISQPFIDKFSFKQKLHDTIKSMWDYPKYGCPRKRGEYHYYSYNTGLQNQSVLYRVSNKNIDGEASVFFDPNLLSDDGTISLGSYAFSKDYRYFAYCLSKEGSDWSTIHFKDIENQKDMEDVLKDVKFSSLAWTHDHKGIFYNKYIVNDKADGTETTSNLNQKLYYHTVGEPQDKDVLISEFPSNPKWMIGAEVSHDGRYVILGISEGCEHVNQLYYIDLENTLKKGQTIAEYGKKLPYTVLVDNFKAEWEYINNNDTRFIFKTNLDSPRSKLVTIDISMGFKSVSDLVPQHNKDVLEWSDCVRQDLLILCYIRDVKNVLEIRSVADGKLLKDIPLEIGSVTSFSGRKEDNTIYFGFTSFLQPNVIYSVEFPPSSINDCTPKVWKAASVKNFKSSEFITEQVFYDSKDGTKIPMFIVRHKNTKLDGKAPALLYVYGGFNISITPTFSISRSVWMDNCGGLMAIANIRGGGEYGEDWHHAGAKEKKFNCFDDTAYAAKFLANNKYSSADRIAIQGGSNGGLVVCSTANRYPDQFSAVVSQVGVLDMLRFHKFTIGHAWTTDYGCSDESVKEFEYIKEFSPLHSIPTSEKTKCYPATLILTADHDDRVVPLHSMKFIAQLQYVWGKNTDKPLLALFDTKAGHGGGKPTAKIIEELTNIYSFLSLVLPNVQWKD